MCVLFVLLVGTPLWWFVSGQTDTVRAMGRGGPLLILGVWAFVVVMASRHVRLRAAGAPGAASVGNRRPVLPPWLRRLTRGYAVALVTIVVLAVLLATRVGDGPQSGILAGVMLLVATLPLALLAAWLCERLRLLPAPAGDEDAMHSPVTVWAGLLPLLSPVLAMWSLQWYRSPEAWALRGGPEALGGTIYFALLPLMLPAAIVVAWGLDRALGVRNVELLSTIAAAALLLLVAGVIVLPNGFEQLAAGEAAFPLDRFARSLRGSRPFSGEGRGMPVELLIRGTAGLMLLASVLSAAALVFWRRGSGTRLLLVTCLLLPLQIFSAAWAIPRYGPEGALGAGVAALLVIGFVVLLRPLAPNAPPAVASVDSGAPFRTPPRATPP